MSDRATMWLCAQNTESFDFFVTMLFTHELSQYFSMQCITFAYGIY